MKEIYIFDLDGTLALIDHRRHLITRPDCRHCEGRGYLPGNDGLGITCNDCKGMMKDVDWKPDWDSFNARCAFDKPSMEIIRIFRILFYIGMKMKIFSGRSESVRALTVDWLTHHLHIVNRDVIERMLTMRPANDFTEDAIINMRWLGFMDDDERRDIACVFDDRDSVVSMWRDSGLTCLQVAPGDF